MPTNPKSHASLHDVTEMGRDIHLHVEVFDGETWVSARPDPSWIEQTEDWHKGALKVRRNYYLFAVLGNSVRNIRIRPISEPRGLHFPCPEVRRLIQEWGRDGHSHSWLRLDELLNFEWTETTVIDGEEIPYHKLCEEFWTDTIPKLLALSRKHRVGYVDLRIVFWFDN